MVSNLYAGVMTGTSLDGIDAVLADFSLPNRPKILAYTQLAYPLNLRLEMLNLQMGSDHTGVNELHRSRIAAIELSKLHCQALTNILDKASITGQDLSAIGVHGQTVRHVPQGVYGDLSTAYTIQLIDSARIAEAMQCTVISDFRANDMAAGGQGAPLVPAFHAALCIDSTHVTAFVNVGGFANITLFNPFRADCHIQGFDTGPGNVLMDAWIQKHLNQPYDTNGEWAASGQVNLDLLQCLQSHSYFSQSAPKSTGRETFHLNWLDSILNSRGFLDKQISPVDVQATLCELTVWSIVNGIRQYLPECTHVYVCGGGAYNRYFMQRLSGYMPCLVDTTQAIGINPQYIEALAFAWLARQCMLRLPANIPAVTGAKGLRILGNMCCVSNNH